MMHVVLMLCFISVFIVDGIGNKSCAVENFTPFNPGVTIGMPIGALPPIGLHFFQSTQFFQMHSKNDQGNDSGPRVYDVIVSKWLIWVPDMPKILGATYGAFVIQPIVGASTGIPWQGSSSNFGLMNTVISPFNLSWNLQNGVFFSIGLTTYGPSANYHTASVAPVNRNYESLEPRLGFSYLTDEWNLSIHPLFDINFTNTSNGYRSGTLFMMDYTALRKFGKFEIGVGGTWTTQFTNDTINGRPVQAVAGVNGYGNRAQNFTIGPVVGYDLGAIKITAYYNQSVYARNIAAGNNFWLRCEIPLAITFH